MTLRLAADDETLAAGFRALTGFNSVALLLEVTPSSLGFHLHSRYSYRIFSLKKRQGGYRWIASPVTRLILIQRKLNQVLHAVFKTRSSVHGFLRGKSIVTNAQRHLRKSWILNLDLENFFPTIHFGRVIGMFEGKPYGLPHPAARTLAQICCYQGVLPVGAPTSPIVSNMICAQMDSRLKRAAVHLGCIYTRYADDITISMSHGRFPPAIAHQNPLNNQWSIGPELTTIIETSGFRINHTKTRVRGRGYRQEVTGLLVGDRVNVKRTYVRRVRATLHACERWGVEKAEAYFHSKYDAKQRVRKPQFLRVLRGRIEFIGAVRGRDDLIYLKLLHRFRNVDPTVTVRPVYVGENTEPKLLDWAVWLLDEINGPVQGTAFALDDLNLVTASHALAPTSRVSCPTRGIPEMAFVVDRNEPHVDVARVSAEIELPIRFRTGNSDVLKIGDEIKVLGYPLYSKGASVSAHVGRIVASSPWHGVPHYIVDCPIIKGMSGGPVLNSMNEVVGIAIKGQQVPKQYTTDDEQSRFVPINFALRYLK